MELHSLPRPTRMSAVSSTLPDESSDLDPTTRGRSSRTLPLHAQLVTGLIHAMDPKERRRREFINSGRRRHWWWGTAPKAPPVASASACRGEHVLPRARPKQYRLTKPPKSKRRNADWEARLEAVIDFTAQSMLNRFFNRYVHWTFQTSLAQVLLSLTACFFTLTTLFAACIMGVATWQPKCIYVGDLDFAQGGGYFVDAFTVSWTTFSTVGYGVAGPNSEGHCVILNMFIALEAFFGVLFVGFSGAILYGKISRMNSVAKVVWSDPIVVRFGPGVDVETPNAETASNLMHMPPLMEDATFSSRDYDDEEGQEVGPKGYPCPMLEFRVANAFFDRIGAEIANAQLSIWASTRAETADAAILQAAGFPSRRRLIGPQPKRSPPERHSSNITRTLTLVGAQLGNIAQKSGQLVQSTIVAHHAAKKRKHAHVTFDKDSINPHTQGGHHHSMTIEQAMEEGRAEILHQLEQFSVSQSHLTVTEDPNNRLTPPMVFSKLNVETDIHPLFKRVWMIRHRLDCNSPLLDAHARKLIADNDGYWPSELNHHAAVRKHLQFHQIMVSLYGTDNATAKSVFSNKLYEYDDVNIGYRFANTLVENPVSGKIEVQLDSIHDVMEQHGGGAEPLRLPGETRPRLGSSDISLSPPPKRKSMATEASPKNN